MIMPEPQLFSRVGLADHRQNQLLIEFAKCRVLKLGSRMGPSSCRHGLKELFSSQLIEELMQMPLDRLNRFLENEEHDNRKGELALTHEILRPHAVPRHEFWITKEST